MKILYRFCLLVCIGVLSGLSAHVQAKTPRLVVVVVYDQMRGDFLERWKNNFGVKGFNRLVREGANFTQCYYDHAANMTGPGHSIIMSGCNPAKTGIVSNEFYDRTMQTVVNCVSDTAFPLPGMAKETGRSPHLLMVSALGDYLHKQSPQAKVIGLSLKDRGAILMAGHSANLALWYESSFSGFTTSRYYAPANPQWVKEWNVRASIPSYGGKQWKLLLPESRYAEPDTVVYEGNFPGGGKVFPHTIPLYDSTKPDDFTYGFFLSPYSVHTLFDLARTAIEKERLGADTIPDILCISVSTTDFVGHEFGPDSREVSDIYLHCDTVLANFIDYLDKRIGRNSYTMVLTADHGVAPIPELVATDSHRPRLDAGRLKSSLLRDSLEKYLAHTFPAQGMKWIKAFEPPSLFINNAALEIAGIQKRMIADTICSFILRWEGMKYAVTGEELEQNKCPENMPKNIFVRIRNDGYPARIGDVVFFPRPYWIYGSAAATHGTPYDYDRHVPLVFFGAGIAPGSRRNTASPADIAPTLAHLLGITLDADGKALHIDK